MKKNSMVFYRSFYEALSTLNDTDFRKLADAVFRFALDGKEEELDGAIGGMFLLIKPQIEANSRRYENGCKGGRPRKDSDKCELEENQTESKTKPSRNQTESKPKPNDNANGKCLMQNVNEKEHPPKSPQEAVVYYPNDTKLDSAFRDYIAMRKQMKKPMTDQAIELARRKLQELSTPPLSDHMDNDIAIQILEQSIVSGWIGLFPLKQDDGGKKKNGDVFEEWRNA